MDFQLLARSEPALARRTLESFRVGVQAVPMLLPRGLRRKCSSAHRTWHSFAMSSLQVALQIDKRIEQLLAIKALEPVAYSRWHSRRC